MSRAWMQDVTGAPVDLWSPPALNIRSVAHSLSVLPRYLGHSVPAWSVAEHSLLCADLAESVTGDPSPVIALLALLHDAHEAYTGDMPTPVQWALEERIPEFMGVWHALQDGIQAQVFAAVERAHGMADRAPLSGASAHTRGLVKLIDRIALLSEKEAILAPSQREWGGEGAVGYEESIRFAVRLIRLRGTKTPRETKSAFLARVEILTARILGNGWLHE